MTSVATSSVFKHNFRSLSAAWPTKRHFHCESLSEHADESASSSVSCCVSSGGEPTAQSLWSSESLYDSKTSLRQCDAREKQNEEHVYRERGRHARWNRERAHQIEQSAYHTYAVDFCSKRLTPPAHEFSQALMMTQLRTTPSAAATPSTPLHQCAATTTTTLSHAPNDLAASSSAEQVPQNYRHEQRKQQKQHKQHEQQKNASVNANPPKRVVTNVLAYWLSLCYENQVCCQTPASSNLVAASKSESFAFVPPYLRNGAFMRAKLHDLCWQCGGSALDYVGALAIVDSIHAHHTPIHLQAALRAFINALGTTTVHAYMQRKGIWKDLFERYQATMQAHDFNCSISERLSTMSNAPLCF